MNKVNEILQIAMMTLYLMAALFGGVGIYYHYKSKDANVARLREVRNLDKLQAFAKKAENIDQIENWLLSKETSTDLGEAVNSVRNSIKLSANIDLTPTRAKSAGGKLMSRTMKVSFKTKLPIDRGPLNFMHGMEVSYPAISLTNVKMVNKDKSVNSSDEWTTEVNMVVFFKEEDEG